MQPSVVSFDVSSQSITDVAASYAVAGPWTKTRNPLIDGTAIAIGDIRNGFDFESRSPFFGSRPPSRDIRRQVIPERRLGIGCREKPILPATANRFLVGPFENEDLIRNQVPRTVGRERGIVPLRGERAGGLLSLVRSWGPGSNRVRRQSPVRRHGINPKRFRPLIWPTPRGL